jgi:TP901 family phage tail tape measure protein
MPFAKIGLGAWLTFNAKQFTAGVTRTGKVVRRFFSKIDIGTRIFPSLSRAMERARPAFKAIEMGARMAGRAIRALMRRVIAFTATAVAGLRRGARQIAGGFRDIAMGMAPITLAVGAGFRAAAQYERQMSAIGAITRANTEDMTAMALEAQRMGVVSVFSAKQIGEGMEFMARAGAKPHQVIAGISGVADAAAADAITLAQAGDVVSRVVKGMGMEWSEAGHIADVLALASASANTNILALGESFVYGVATSRQMGVSLEETTAIMAKMADAGLRGSLGGTAYANMMSRLGKTTAKGRKILSSFGIKLEKTDGSLRKVADIVADFEKKLNRVKGVTTKQGIVMEVFGRRGARAYNALAAAGAKATKDLEIELRASSEGIGAAARMAERRLDNFLGRLVLLKSSLEGLAIGVFLPFLRKIARSTKSLVEGLNKVLFALNKINAAFVLGKEVEFTAEEVDKFGEDAIQIAWGIRDAMTEIGEAWDWLMKKAGELGDRIKEAFGGTGGLRGATKLIVQFLVLGSLLTPLILGLGLVKWAIAGFIKIALGVGTMLLAVFWPLVIVAGALYLAYRNLRKENESFFETSVRVWGDIKAWILDVWENAVKPLWEGFNNHLLPVLHQFRVMAEGVINVVISIFRMLYQEIFGGNEMTRNDWHDTGRTISSVLLGVARFVTNVVGGILTLVKTVMFIIIKLIKVVTFFIDKFAKGLAKVILGFQEIGKGNILKGLKRIGVAILDWMLSPIQLLLKGVMALMDWLNLSHKIPAGFEKFVKEGITGFAFAKETGIDDRPVFKTREEMLEKQFGIPAEAKVKPVIDPNEYQFGIGLAAQGKLEREYGFEFPTAKGILSESRFESIGEIKEGMANLGDRVEKAVKEKPCVEVESKIDGKNLLVASGKSKQEFKERAGFRSTPWQRRALLEHGATPITKAG